MCVCVLWVIKHRHHFVQWTSKPNKDSVYLPVNFWSRATCYFFLVERWWECIFFHRTAVNIRLNTVRKAAGSMMDESLLEYELSLNRSAKFDALLYSWTCLEPASKAFVLKKMSVVSCSTRPGGRPNPLRHTPTQTKSHELLCHKQCLDKSLFLLLQNSR